MAGERLSEDIHSGSSSNNFSTQYLRYKFRLRGSFNI